MICDEQTEEMMAKGKQVVKNNWGPVLATRTSNIIKPDGKSMIEKAHELKKPGDLQVTKFPMVSIILLLLWITRYF
jgi:hypothetical protein